jgi:hypothetical protein
MLLTLLPATVEGRLYLVLVLTLVLLPGLVWGVRMVVRKEPLLKRRGTALLLVLLSVLLSLWWWVFQTRVIVAGWHTVVY